MNVEQLKNIIEAALLASANPLAVDKLLELFTEDEEVKADDISNVLNILAEDCATRGVELKEVRSGFRLQVKQEYSEWVSKLWQERPSRYSRALLETLALIAYRQPITRGEVEQVRGVSVSSQIMKTLLERTWVKVVGHRDVPGKPALYATTKEFLDYFNLKNLSELPPLSEIRDIESINAELEFGLPGSGGKPAIKPDQGDSDIVAEALLNDSENPDDTEINLEQLSSDESDNPNDSDISIQADSSNNPETRNEHASSITSEQDVEPTHDEKLTAEN